MPLEKENAAIYGIVNIMNWYRELKISQSPVAQEELTYLDVGHGDEEGNFLWVLYNGRIDIKEVSEAAPLHNDAWPYVNFGRVFAGRYEGSTGTISIKEPIDGAARFTVDTVGLFDALKMKFPDHTSVKVF